MGWNRINGYEKPGRGPWFFVQIKTTGLAGGYLLYKK